jgi:predicted DNA-binding protein YlxM (UPF0122 family)
MKLKDGYIRAGCCKPQRRDSITGYYSHDNVIKVHRRDCPSLKKTEPDRLVQLEWPDILAPEDFQPGEDYHGLTDVDFRVMQHHGEYGVDYSLKVAGMLNIDRQAVFDSHTRLRELGLLERVEPRIIQYRKNIVKNKWIKHRNHTYYDLTGKGRQYLDYFLKSGR